MQKTTSCWPGRSFFVVPATILILDRRYRQSSEVSYSTCLTATLTTFGVGEHA